MSYQIASQTVKIVNPQGLHARPANVFVRCAAQFQCDIEIVKDGERVDGKSILGLLTLAAEEGSELAIQAKGPDAQQAIRLLVELVTNGFEEIASSNNNE